jgi:hypothetical protein
MSEGIPPQLDTKHLYEAITPLSDGFAAAGRSLVQFAASPEWQALTRALSEFPTRLTEELNKRRRGRAG